MHAHTARPALCIITFSVKFQSSATDLGPIPGAINPG